MSGYMGNGPGLSVFSQYDYVASAGQATFSGPDANGFTLSYTPRYILVFVNGKKVNQADFTAMDGSTVNFAIGRLAGDTVSVFSLATLSVANTLVPTNNLADVASVPAAIANLGVAAIGHAIATIGTTATDTSANMPGASNTAPTNTQGSQLLTVTFTPKNVASIIVVEGWAVLAASLASYAQIALFRDSITNAIASDMANPAGSGQPLFYRAKCSFVAGSTSLMTFKLRFGLDRTGTCYANGNSSGGIGGGTMFSGIEVTEYTS